MDILLRRRRGHAGRRRLAALAIALCASGCTAHRTPDPFRGEGVLDPTVLEVENRHWADMTVSVRRGARVFRLGLVTTNGHRRFVLPAGASLAGEPASLLADPVGSGSVYESPSVVFAAGETYLWTLAVSLDHSTLQRR